MTTRADRSTGTGRGRRARLSRDLVLRAAIALADGGGLDAVTMQAVGRRLGVEAMSLYRHVRNKDDILDGIVDLVFSEIDLPASGTPPRSRVRRRAVSARAALARHPWAVGRLEAAKQPG